MGIEWSLCPPTCTVTVTIRGLVTLRALRGVSNMPLWDCCHGTNMMRGNTGDCVYVFPTPRKSLHNSRITCGVSFGFYDVEANGALGDLDATTDGSSL